MTSESQTPVAAVTQPASPSEARTEQRVNETLDQVQNLIDRETLANSAGNQSSAVNSHAIRSPEVSIVVPVYNEAATIAEILARLLKLPIDAEIIAVDDASTDGTREILRAMEGTPRLHYIPKPINEGKGAALHTGFRQAIGSIIVIQDADLEYEPETIPHLIEPIRQGRAEVVYGSRFLGDDSPTSDWHRWGNRCLTAMSNWTTGLHLTDMETCQKAFSRILLGGLPLHQSRFGFEPEITARLAQLQARFVELPVPYHPRSYREGKKIGWRDLITAVYCILRYGCCS